MAGAQLAVDEGRDRGQLHDRLGDPRPRVGQHLPAQLVELGPRRARADHDALAARTVDRLEHQLVEPVQDLLTGLGVTAAPGVDVAQHRLLVEVVADQVGQVGVDELVVGHAVADRVGQGHVARPGGVDHAGAAEHRVGAEVHRVEELVVDAAVDHVHRLQALGGAHHHATAPALQVAPLDQLHAHRAGQQRVLEVGAVVDTGRQHHHGRVGDTGRGGGAQRGEQPLRVAGDGADAVLGDRLGQGGGDRAPVGHHVRDPRRHPHVVLEDAELAGVVADQVDAGDVDPDAVRRPHPGGLAVVVRRRRDHPAGDDAVVEDLPGVVHVGEEGLQRAHPLLDAALDGGPGVHLDHPRQDVEREGPLLAADVEGDALVEVGGLQRLHPTDQLRSAHLAQRVTQPAVRRSERLPVEHLVVRRAARPVSLEHGRHARTIPRSELRERCVRGESGPRRRPR